MSKEKKNLDYEKLLDDWAEELFEMSRQHEKLRDMSEIGSVDYGYHAGMSNAYVTAVTKLTFLEKRKSKKYKTEE